MVQGWQKGPRVSVTQRLGPPPGSCSQTWPYWQYVSSAQGPVSHCLMPQVVASPGHLHTSPRLQSPLELHPATQRYVVVSQIWPNAHWTSRVQCASSMQLPVSGSQNCPLGQSNVVE